jgi:hypothetical protein
LNGVNEEDGNEYEADFEGVGYLSDDIRLKNVTISIKSRKTWSTNLGNKVEEFLAAMTVSAFVSTRKRKVLTEQLEALASRERRNRPSVDTMDVNNPRRSKRGGDSTSAASKKNVRL